MKDFLKGISKEILPHRRQGSLGPLIALLHFLLHNGAIRI